MKKVKSEKAITLIVLIVTIAVLLIIAAVALDSIRNDGILSYTKNVESKWNSSKNKLETLNAQENSNNNEQAGNNVYTRTMESKWNISNE